MSVAEQGDLLAIAHLVRPHGLRGEIAAEPLVPEVLDPVQLMIERRLFLRDKAGRVSEVSATALRPHQDRWLITLAGIEDVDQADALRGADLCLPRNELPALPEGWYYEADLERCRVTDETYGEIGHVEALETNSAQPSLRVKRPDGGTILIPWVKAYFTHVDVPAGELKTNLPQDFPGL